MSINDVSRPSEAPDVSTVASTTLTATAAPSGGAVTPTAADVAAAIPTGPTTTTETVAEAPAVEAPTAADAAPVSTITEPVIPPATEFEKAASAAATAHVLAERSAAQGVAQETSVPDDGIAPPVWPELKEDHPLAKFRQALPAILESTGYDEVYGLRLTVDPVGAFSTNLILQKFLRANANDLTKARAQLEKTLVWRKEFKPLQTVDEVYSQIKFENLGYVGRFKGDQGKQVITFNLYGSVQDKKNTFGDVDR